MFKTIDDVKHANQAIGHHWFDRDAMAFFKTKYESDIIRGRFFVTSEQPPHGPREFRVRMAADDGKITSSRPIKTRPEAKAIALASGAAGRLTE